MANPTMMLIASQTLATSATVTFSSIPTTYNDLKLLFSTKDVSATFPIGGIVVTFNSDTATNYSWIQVLTNYASAGGVSSQLNSSQTSDNIGVGASSGSSVGNIWGNGELYIPNYNSTGQKPFLAPTLTEQNSATPPGIYLTAGLYRGTSGITSMTITAAGGGNFVAGSSFYLYGIKNS